MIRHIVVFKLKASEENVIEADFQNIKSKLEALTVAHEGIKSLDVYRGMRLRITRGIGCLPSSSVTSRICKVGRRLHHRSSCY